MKVSMMAHNNLTDMLLCKEKTEIASRGFLGKTGLDSQYLREKCAKIEESESL